MKCCRVRGCVWMPVAASALLLAGCAADKLEDPAYWWDAKIVSVEPLREVPADVDLGCVGEPGGGDRTVMVVQYRVRKSLLTTVYADPGGAKWFSGERVRVHPDTCRIKPASRAS